MGLGTAINVVAVLVGGGIGTLLGRNSPEAMRHTSMQAIGIVTLLVGVSNFLELDRTSTHGVQDSEESSLPSAQVPTLTLTIVK
jgi:uncharacterized membrane protein YqgA involved in biofilm formation